MPSCLLLNNYEIHLGVMLEGELSYSNNQDNRHRYCDNINIIGLLRILEIV